MDPTEPFLLSVPVPSQVERRGRYYLDLDSTISSELSLMGIVRLLGDQWRVWPLMGTNRIYLENIKSKSCTNSLIRSRLNYLATNSLKDSSGVGDSGKEESSGKDTNPGKEESSGIEGELSEEERAYCNLIAYPSFELNDREDVEIFTMMSFESLPALDRVGLIRVNQHWYSILGLYQSGYTKKLVDPLTRQILSPELTQQIHEIVGLLPPSLTTGFPPPTKQFKLIQTTSTYNSTKFVEFFLLSELPALGPELPGERVFLWAVPDFRECEDDDLKNMTLDAIEIITLKFSNQVIFQDRRHHQDVHLNLDPRMLYLCERSYGNLHSKDYHELLTLQIKDFEEMLDILDQI